MCRAIEGWSNYPTYAWRQWNMSNQGNYDYWEEIANEILTSTPGKDGFTDIAKSKRSLADAMKLDFEEGNPLTEGSGPYHDMMQWLINHIDWYEIAESWIDGIIEEQQRGAVEP